MNIEHEVRVLEINIEKTIKDLEKLGAKKVGEMNYKRYVYHTLTGSENEWIRLRTDGNTSTITYKNVIDNTITGTKELEIEVNDFEKTKELIEVLGFKQKGYQENKRIRYMLNNVEIDLDSWPMIPPYLEFEGENEEEILKVVELLQIDKTNLTCLNCSDIYKTVYGIDIDKIKSISFDHIEYKEENI